jgi:hypothetical protein
MRSKERIGGGWARLCPTSVSFVSAHRLHPYLLTFFCLLPASGNAGGIIIFCLLLASLCVNLYYLCRGAVVVSFRDHPICHWPRRICDRGGDDVNQGGDYQQAESGPRTTTTTTTMTPLLSRHREAPPDQSAVVLDAGRCTALYVANDTGTVPKRNHPGSNLLEGASSVGGNLQEDLEAGPARATGYRRRRRHSTEEHELTTF